MKQEALLFSFVLITIFLVSSAYAQSSVRISLLIDGLNEYNFTYYDSVSNETFNFTDFSDYNISFYSLYVFDYEKDNSSFGNFTAKLFYSDGSSQEKIFNPDFLLLSDPPIELNSTLVDLSFLYKEGLDKIEVYYLGSLKLSYNLNSLSNIFCNHNSICDNNETYLSCSDCKFYDKDGICNDVDNMFNVSVSYWNDKFCDLDCNEDDDCNIANCNDGIKNQNETSIDKGGECNIIYCADGIKNYDETGIDCGGYCPYDCALNLLSSSTVVLTSTLLSVVSSWMAGTTNLNSLMSVISSWISSPPLFIPTAPSTSSCNRDGICSDDESWFDELNKINCLDNSSTLKIDDCLLPPEACCIYKCSDLSTNDVEYLCHDKFTWNSVPGIIGKAPENIEISHPSIEMETWSYYGCNSGEICMWKIKDSYLDALNQKIQDRNTCKSACSDGDVSCKMNCEPTNPLPEPNMKNQGISCKYNSPGKTLLSGNKEEQTGVCSEKFKTCKIKPSWYGTKPSSDYLSQYSGQNNIFTQGAPDVISQRDCYCKVSITWLDLKVDKESFDKKYQGYLDYDEYTKREKVDFRRYYDPTDSFMRETEGKYALIVAPGEEMVCDLYVIYDNDTCGGNVKAKFTLNSNSASLNSEVSCLKKDFNNIWECSKKFKLPKKRGENYTCSGYPIISVGGAKLELKSYEQTSRDVVVARYLYVFAPIKLHISSTVFSNGETYIDQYKNYKETSQVNQKIGNSGKLINIKKQIDLGEFVAESKRLNEIRERKDEEKIRNFITKEININIEGKKDDKIVAFNSQFSNSYAYFGADFIYISYDVVNAFSHEMGHSSINSELCDEYSLYYWLRENLEGLFYSGRCRNPFPKCCLNRFSTNLDNTCNIPKNILRNKGNACKGMPYEADEITKDENLPGNEPDKLGPKHSKMGVDTNGNYPIEAQCPLRNCLGGASGSW